MPSNVRAWQDIQHSVLGVLLKKIIKSEDERGRDETKHGPGGIPLLQHHPTAATATCAKDRPRLTRGSSD